MDTSQKITHVLNRLSWGARSGDRAKIERIGIESYIQAQLNSANAAEPTTLINRLNALPTLKLSALQLFEQYGTPKNDSEAAERKLNQSRALLLHEAVQARLLRAIDSPHQLREVMVDFWFNHFNVYEGKGLTQIWTSAYEQSAIRPHVLGKFGDLLKATAQHPAMLFYLDNWRNTDPHSDSLGRLRHRANGPFQGLNENYARELMELHTLGMNGGYSQADVESLARILTGWGIVREPSPSADHSEDYSADHSGFVFARDRHDASDKVLLGATIPGGGQEEGEAAIALLAQHPATAWHISYKLAQYFVADAPPTALVDRLAERFSSTQGDIPSVLLALFESDEFWQMEHYQRKFKTPLQYLLSMARATELTSPSVEHLKRLSGLLNQLGMPLYRCLTPNGYAQIEEVWLNPDAMVRRVSFAIATLNNQGENPPTPEALLQTLGHPFSSESLAVINSAPVHLRSALILGSPEMMYR